MGVVTEQCSLSLPPPQVSRYQGIHISCQISITLKSMICWSKNLDFTFLNFLAIRLVPYSILSLSLFNPHLSSLVPLKIVQVELEKLSFKYQTHEKPTIYKNNMYEIKVLGCGGGILRCSLCSHTLCHQF